ncbi:hypothetical protein [Limnohabitans lacus]|uniref:Uncharacterized protein n=1 Tax=Limnohabitans lacus TaxID=3045173 RepID=A0ABT6XAH3_9BURK|nr:hypothetical protein [Limnohabitans sp. HM2-2]MDI9235137.1 hypothetical protein [Limnohabitans sp. HM2-2]
MINTLNKFFAVLLIIIGIAACGKKQEDGLSTNNPPAATDNTPIYRQTEKFGTVSNQTLVPVFEVPSQYTKYTRQEVSEASKDEYQKLPEFSFEGYVNTWIQQAASVENPDWIVLAGIINPQLATDTNEFKKQEAAEKIKNEMASDKSKLNVVYGWQGEMLYIAGPDVSNGEYYLTIRPNASYQVVSYLNSKNYRYSLFYRPDFKALGMLGDNRGDMQLTVKVPVEKAKEIESLRDGQKTMIRVYGIVKGLTDERRPQIRKDSSEASLRVEVKALEFGVRMNGQFKTFFFLDSDQLKKSKT